MKIRHLLASQECVKWTRFGETTCIFLMEGCSWWILAIGGFYKKNFGPKSFLGSKILNLRLSKLLSTKVLFKLEFDTKDQVLLNIDQVLPASPATSWLYITSWGCTSITVLWSWYWWWLYPEWTNKYHSRFPRLVQFLFSLKSHMISMFENYIFDCSCEMNK